MIKFLLKTALILLLVQNAAGQTYRALYRPQFHFSPLSGWIGDPDGTIKYKDKYHLFWWGHASSDDLVFWKQEPWPMQGDDGSFIYYTGSVVVDTANTSGFKADENAPMVAIYTMHNKTNNIESQGISVSSDYSNFQYYNANPVLTLQTKDFRDPDVFWDKQTNKWIMAITLPIERKVAFYASDNLLSWQYLSDFGPMGAVSQVWEVPGLHCLPVDGDESNKKWILFSGMGPNKEQYFIGNFDGTNFIPDNATTNYIKNGTGIPGDIYEDFEKTNYGSWTNTGTAFATAPSSGALGNQQNVSGYLGTKLANSFFNGDISTGTLTSADFVITKNCINFLIAGGKNAGKTCINLLVNGNIVRTATGDNSECLKWSGWDVSNIKGSTAKLQIVDNYTGGWGHINVDHIMFSDVLYNYNYEHANWIDYGPDFYALRAYRDYDNSESRTVWMAWMGNWDYANSVPTTWGKGFESIPREIKLKTTPNGIRVFQEPLPELKKLRIDTSVISNKLINSTFQPEEFKPTRNTFEIVATFELKNDSADFGMNFCVIGDKKMILGYNSRTSTLYLDRRTCGNVSFNSSFPRKVTAPLMPLNGKIKLHVFVDQSSVEVFANDGEIVMSALMFPDTKTTDMQLFSTNGDVNLLDFTAYRLNSIWGLPEEPRTGIYSQKTSNVLYPNPLQAGHELKILSSSTFWGKGGQLDIYNSAGILVKQLNIPSNTYSIPGTTDLKSGLYLLKFSFSGNVFSEKLIVL